MALNSFSVSNQEFSCGPPLVLPIDLNFSAQLSIDLDLSEIIDRKILDFISTVFIDNYNINQTIICETNLVAQRIVARPNTIGYYPVMVGNSPKFKFTASGLIVPPIKVIFSNIPYYPYVY